MTASVAPRPQPLWQNRDYRLLWSGQAVSILGSQMSQLAFPLLVLALTGSAAQAGFVTAVRSVPWLLFALPAGALVDRWPRKPTLILCSLGGALALGSIALAYALGILTIWQIVIVSFIEGTLALFFGLAESSALPQVVPKEQLPAAVAQQQAQYSVGGLLGPPLGGALFGIAQLLPFLLDAVSYAISAIALRLIRHPLPGAARTEQRSLRAEIGEGVTWLWRQPLVRYMAFLTGAFNFTGGLDLIIIVIARTQGASAATIGLIFALGGAGGVLGAILAPRIQRRFSFGQVIVGLTWFTAGIFLLFAGARSLVAVAAILIVFFTVIPWYDTVQYSYRLALIPNALQGRVNSAFRLVALGLRPIGVALTGLLLEWIGATSTLLVLGAWLLIVALLTTTNRHVRTAPPIAQALAH
ncbi:MAG TPA: MFS transporter [Thermomicrobiales bacterium]|jgi:predicted MFS family arabinose efflux permease